MLLWLDTGVSVKDIQTEEVQRRLIEVGDAIVSTDHCKLNKPKEQIHDCAKRSKPCGGKEGKCKSGFFKFPMTESFIALPLTDGTGFPKAKRKSLSKQIKDALKVKANQQKTALQFYADLGISIKVRRIPDLNNCFTNQF